MHKADLAREISTFNRLLPSLRIEHGDSWVVIVGTELEGAYHTFAEAAVFATSKFADQDFLIRRTDAPEPQIPFLVIEE